MVTKASLLIFLIAERNTVLDKPDGLSIYARLFDSKNLEWKDNPEYNLTYLEMQEKWFNHHLKAMGHVFLNEVYDNLGFDRTSNGAIVGWMVNPKESDGYINFGLFNVRNNAFINGIELNVWLDFNVDGVIYDKLPTDKET